MFLYFYDSRYIIGFNDFSYYTDNDDDNMIEDNMLYFINTDEYEADYNNLFDGWKTEEATTNETFYLVFETNKNKKWYFSQIKQRDYFNEDVIVNPCQMQNTKKRQQNFIIMTKKQK